MNTLLTLILVGTLQVTAYRSVENQTDSTPFITSTGEHVHKHGAAVSPNLLCPLAYGKAKTHKRAKCQFKDRLHYDDMLYVPGLGFKIVNDVTAEHIKSTVDLWCDSLKCEKETGVTKRQIYLVEMGAKL